MNIIIYTLVILTILYFLLKFITKISSKKISKVYNNVVYNSDQLNLITDKILIDMVSGDIKFRMIDKNNKIKFKTKHEFIN